MLLARLSSLLGRLRRCAAATSVSGGDSMLRGFLEAEQTCRYAHDALGECEEGIHHLRALQKSIASSRDLERVVAYRRELLSLVADLAAVTISSRRSSCSLFTLGEELVHHHTR